MTVIHNRGNDIASLQISRMGDVVNLITSDFGIPDTPINIKNLGDAVELEVNLWNMPEDEFVTTIFDNGWNPEIVRKIRQTTTTCTLQWGY